MTGEGVVRPSIPPLRPSIPPLGFPLPPFGRQGVFWVLVQGSSIHTLHPPPLLDASHRSQREEGGVWPHKLAASDISRGSRDCKLQTPNSKLAFPFLPWFSLASPGFPLPPLVSPSSLGFPLPPLGRKGLGMEESEYKPNRGSSTNPIELRVKTWCAQ